MKICLITSFPPSHERLNEYGYHLAAELQRDPFLSLTVLADEYDGHEPELPEFEVIRCWRPNSMGNPAGVIRAVRDIRPDIVWFNSVFSSFGTKPAPAFLGLCTPAMVRAAGYSTHITLHHLMEGINLADAGVKHPLLYTLGGTVATRLLLMANSVTVLLPAYRRTLLQKYHGKNVHLRAHGVFAGTPKYPDFSRRDNPEQRILAFGKWGTYKRLEVLIDAFRLLAKSNQHARLVIAGENHPSAPGYVESIAERVKDDPQIAVRGYVDEADIPELFTTASVMVMPYTSATGASGVAHQACQFGVPIVCADIPDFHDMAAEEHIAMEFFRKGNVEDMATCMSDLLQDDVRRREMAEQNFHAAMRMTMPQIIRQYLRTFDLHRHVRKAISATALWRPRPAQSWASFAVSGSVALPPAPAPIPIIATGSTAATGPLLAVSSPQAVVSSELSKGVTTSPEVPAARRSNENLVEQWRAAQRKRSGMLSPAPEKEAA